MAKRRHFTKNIIETLMKRAGGLCANPKCLVSTIGPNMSHSQKSDTIGIAAHIKGAQPSSARYDESQLEEERHGINNGLWLCSNCATLIDKNGGADFPVSTLKIWKGASEKAARERLLRSARSVKENCVSTLIFINVPRLIHFFELDQSGSHFPEAFAKGIPSDRMVIQELVSMERAIKNAEFPALDWREVIADIPDPTGMLVSFEGQFWTKNAPKSRKNLESVDFTDLKFAPHIYAKDKDIKFVLPYDPRFLTTNTALAEFSSGRMNVGGFALIKKRKDKEVWASPLFIGLRSQPAARALMDALSAR